MNAQSPIKPASPNASNARIQALEGKSACVIGAGFGGLALAMRLQSAGVQTTVIEARDKPGGRGYFWEKDGFTFDAGPTVVTDPPCLEELWSISGHDMKEDVELMKVHPFYRLNWPDGHNFDYSNDVAELNEEIRKLNPDDVAGYQRFLDYSAGVYEEGYVKLGTVPFLDFKSMLKAAPALAKKQAWRSVYSIVSKYIQNEKIRQALSFHTLLVGGDPFKTSAIYTLIHKLEKDGGVWWTRGGTNRLIAGMIRHFERLGGTDARSAIRWCRCTRSAIARPKSKPKAAFANGSTRWPAMATSCTPIATCCPKRRAAKATPRRLPARNSAPACSWCISGWREPGPVSRIT